MASEYDCGFPLYVGGAFYTAANWRQYEGGICVQDAGTATAVSPASGVYKAAGGELKVTAPSSGMTVSVGAGYCAVSNTAGTGIYRFGLMTQGSLTVATNSTGSTRQDYVIANVQDLETTGSFAQIQYLTGTSTVPGVPANSLVLAQVAVPNGASSITGSDITDLRSWVAPPGCIIPIATLADAPVVPTGQLLVDLQTSQLIYSPVTTVTQTLSTSGTWTCPEFVTSVAVGCRAGGGGGTSLTAGGAGGGGGEYAYEPELGVTPGRVYSYTIGQGGQGGAPYNAGATSGTATTFAGDTLLVTAHPGQGISGSTSGSPGGTGSANTVHFNGGNGGNGAAGSYAGNGGGGGASASAAGPGAAGSNATSVSGAQGGAGPYGGLGGAGGTSNNGGNGFAPGGGGGGGGGVNDGYVGGSGAAGQIIVTYTVAPGPSPYPLYPVPVSSAWYAYDSSTGIVATAYGPVYNYGYGYYQGGGGPQVILDVRVQADGSSDYSVEVGCFAVNGEGGLPASLYLTIDGGLVDTLHVTGGSQQNFNWSYYTSGAQGTTMSAGTHTVSFVVSSTYFESVNVYGPAFLRVARVQS